MAGGSDQGRSAEPLGCQGTPSGREVTEPLDFRFLQNDCGPN